MAAREHLVRIENDLYRRIVRFANSELLISTSVPRAANWLIRRGLREVENRPEKEHEKLALPIREHTG